MSRISNFPIMFFAIIMGFGGFSMAIRKVSVVFEINSLYFDIFKIITSAIFLLVVLYIFFNFSQFMAKKYCI